jgi:hypothetical protein
MTYQRKEDGGDMTEKNPPTKTPSSLEMGAAKSSGGVLEHTIFGKTAT